jgi:YihY family inner membrane protein
MFRRVGGSGVSTRISFGSASAFVRAVAAAVEAAGVSFLAAGLAYYAFVSLIPLLVLAVVAAATVGGEALVAQVLALTGQYLVPSGQELVGDALRNTTGQGGVAGVGLVLVVWSALKVFRGLDTAFATIYGRPAGGTLEQVRDGLVALAAVGVGVFAVTVAGAAVVAAPVPFVGLLAPVVLLATLVAAFLPLYYVFPGVEGVTPREVLPGTLVAAVGWTVLGVGFGIYADVASRGSLALYGILGAVLLLVTYFYLASMVLLVGGVVNAVAAGRGPDRQLQHPGARATGRAPMSGEDADGSGDRDGDGPGDDRPRTEPRAAADISELEDRLDEVRADLDAFESDVRDRTVDKPDFEAELKRYVRRQLRRGKARGWGPYLVLLYGTAMTLGAFYFLEGGWAILAMLILFLSTLGLYVLFVMVGLGLNVLSVPARAADAVRDRRG